MNERESVEQEAPIKVGLFVTCLVDLFRPSVGFAAVKLLEDAGCVVDVPMAQTCCGQPAYNSGDRADARAIVENAIATFEDFERYLRDHPEEARDVAALLSRIDGDPEVSATVRYADGQELTLVQEDGRWRISGNPANLYDQSTPRAAVRSFVRAMERRRYDIVLRFVPNASREGMDEERLRESFEGEGREEIERLLASLRANLDNPIEEVGDRATMTYGEGAAVQLILEDGVWKVEDPD